MEVTGQLPERRVPTRGGPWGMSLSEAGGTRRGLLLPLSALNLIRYFFLFFFLWPRLTRGGPRHNKEGQVVGVRWRWGCGGGSKRSEERALLLLITGFLSGGGEGEGATPQRRLQSNRHISWLRHCIKRVWCRVDYWCLCCSASIC